MAPHADAPLCSATSSSARQLYLLLRCIAFSNKTQVRLSPEGLRFSAEETSVMEAFVFLSKSLFTTYTYHDPPVHTHNINNNEDESEIDDETSSPPTFQLSLPALLETLQIFTTTDSSSSSSTNPSSTYDGFAAHRLHNRPFNPPFFSPAHTGHPSLCRLSYHSRGSPLSIHLSEAGVTTTADLTAYDAPSQSDIPFDRDAVALKAIMRATHLADAVSELASTNPTVLTLIAAPSKPWLALSATGPLGSATVEFDKAETQLLETFVCEERVVTRYRFAHVRAAWRAMVSATKVSIRTDAQGVLSLQFLVEVEAALLQRGEGRERDGVAFVDFRIVPLVEGEGDEGDEGSSGTEDRM